jgi:hypothetical protein
MSSVRGPQESAKILRKIPVTVSALRSGLRVERGRRGVVVGVDEHDPIHRVLGHAGEQHRRFVLGLDEHQPAPLGDVVQRHVQQQAGLAGVGTADDVRVVAGIRDPLPDEPG